MLTRSKFILLGICVLLQFNTYSADLPYKKTAKTVAKIDLLFFMGIYNKAEKLNDKLSAKQQKFHKNKQNAEVGLTTLRGALIAGELSDFVKMEGNITKGLQILENTSGKESLNYCNGLLLAMRTWTNYGNYNKALGYQKTIEATLPNIQDNKNKFLIDYKFYVAELYNKVGYFKKALTYAKEAAELRKGNIIKFYDYVDPKTGQIKSKKLNSAGYLDRKRQYAHALNLIMEIYIDKGDYYTAKDSLYPVHTKWMEKNMGGSAAKKDYAYIWATYLKGSVYWHARRYELAMTPLEESINGIIKAKGVRVSPTSRQYEEIYDKLMVSFFRRDKDRNVTRYKQSQKSFVQRMFKNEGIRQGNRETLIAEDFLINKSDTKKASIDLQRRHRKGEETLIEIIEKHHYYPNDHPRKAYVLQRLMKIFANSDRPEEARKYLNMFVNLNKEIYPDDSPYLHMAKIEEAIFLGRYTNEFQKAEDIFNESFYNVVRNAIHPRHKDYFYYQNEIIDLYKITDRYEKALKTAKAATALCRKNYAKTDIPLMVQLEIEASLLMDNGQFKEAYTNLQEGREIMKNKEHKLKARLLKTRARYYNIMGNYNLATSLLEEAEKIADFSTVEEYADLYISKGYYSKVEERLEEAIDKIKARYGNEHRSLVTKYQRLAKVHLIVGDYDKAQKEIERAMNIAKTAYGETSLLFTECEVVLGQVYLKLGDFYHAERTYRDAIKNQERLLKTRSQVPIALTLSELAKAYYLNSNDAKGTEKMFLEAKDIITEKLGSKNPAYAKVAIDLAELYIDMDKLEDAEFLVKQAINLHENVFNKHGKVTRELAFAILLEGDILEGKKNYSKALSSYSKAADELKGLFGEEHIDHVRALSKIGQLWYIQGEDKKAIKILNETTALYMKNIRNNFSILSEDGKKKFWDEIKSDFEFYNTIALKYKDDDPSLIAKVYDITLSTKAILLSSSIKLRQSIISSGDKELIEKYKEWRILREELTVYDSWDNDKIKELEIDKEAIKKSIIDLEKELSEKSDAFATESAKEARRNSISWQKVQKELKENEFAVEIIRYRYFDETFTDSVIYAALVVGPETKKAPMAVVLEKGNDLEDRYLKYYRNSIKYQTNDNRSYDAFWKQIHEVVGDNSRVYLSSEGAFNQINLESIPTPDGKNVLDNNTIILVSNTKDLYEAAEEKRRKQDLISKGKLKPRVIENSAILIGNPAFYEVRVNPNDTVFITINDSVYAELRDHIYITASDNVIAEKRHQAIIQDHDNIYATFADHITLTIEDSIYIRERDNIYANVNDNVINPKTNKPFTLEDKHLITLEDSVFIRIDHGVIAKDFHGRIIKSADNITALPSHKKLISVSDKVYATKEDKIYITESDKIVNEAVYKSMKIAQLPGAEKEINDINGILENSQWKVEKYVFADALEDNIKSWKKSPRVFHIATHGFFEEDSKKSNKTIQGLSHLKENQDPLQRSGVMLKNAGDIFKNHRSGAADFNSESGVLTAAEALALNFENTELVVLSACETGRGQVAVGEGVYGLQRSFLVAGANNVIMSLFKVSDEATQKLMALFYEKWTKTGDKRQAFIDAKKELREEFKDPIYWGAFVMIGLD